MIVNLRRRFAALGALILAAAAPASAFPAVANASPAVVPVANLTPPELPESIAIDHRGNMYLSLFPLGQIMKITPEGARSTFAELPDGTMSAGVRLDESGNIYVAVFAPNNAADNGVWRVPAHGGAPAEIAQIPGFPNGLAFDRQGNLYVTDSLGGAIYRITPAGAVSKWSDSPLLAGTSNAGPCGDVHPSHLPLGANGLAFDNRGHVFVTNTTLGTIIRIRVNHDGSAGGARVFAGPDCRLWGADGLAMDVAGSLYVAANAKQDIVRAGPYGGLHVIASSAAGDPLQAPSDIAFGAGRLDREHIFITNFALFGTGVGPGVVTTDVEIPGHPLP